jgi:hypothetical protein
MLHVFSSNVELHVRHVDDFGFCALAEIKFLA